MGAGSRGSGSTSLAVGRPRSPSWCGKCPPRCAWPSVSGSAGCAESLALSGCTQTRLKQKQGRVSRDTRFRREESLLRAGLTLVTPGRGARTPCLALRTAKQASLRGPWGATLRGNAQGHGRTGCATSIQPPGPPPGTQLSAAWLGAAAGGRARGQTWDRGAALPGKSRSLPSCLPAGGARLVLWWGDACPQPAGTATGPTSRTFRLGTEFLGGSRGALGGFQVSVTQIGCLGARRAGGTPLHLYT